MRQFVYLDDLAVQSLLASEGRWIPESRTEIEEEGKEIAGDASGKLGLDMPFVGEANFGGDISGSKTGKEILEAQKRINDQGLFNEFYNEIEDEITNVEDEGISPPRDDLIEIQGTIETDAIYRFLKTFNLYGDIVDDENAEKISKAEELLYSRGIGVSIDTDDSNFKYAATLKPDSLWIEEERAFLDKKEFTVLARIYDTFDGDEYWDYIDIVKMIDTMIDDNTMNELRDFAAAFIEMIGQASEEFERPAIEEMEVDQFSQLQKIQETASTVTSDFELSIDEKELSLQGPGVVVSPIAIYW